MNGGTVTFVLIEALSYFLGTHCGMEIVDASTSGAGRRGEKPSPSIQHGNIIISDKKPLLDV